MDSAFWTASGPACSLFVHQTEPLEGEGCSLLGPASPAQAPARNRVLDGRSLLWSASQCGLRVQGRQTVHRQAEHLLCAVAGAQRSRAPGATASGGSSPHPGLTAGPESGPRESCHLRNRGVINLETGCLK